LAAIGSFQIEGDTALGRVVLPKRQTALRVGDVVEKRPDVTVALTTGRFNFDHIGTEIAEKLAAELASFVRKLEDSEACQRAR
jgi:hypothetical protein